MLSCSLFRIREVPGSNIDQISAILTEVFHGFPQSFQENAGPTSKLSHDRFLPYPFQLRYTPIILSFDAI
jgi:hypothetical protein